MQSSSSVKRNIVLSLSVLFVIGFASFGSIGRQVHAATVQPLQPVPTFYPTSDILKVNKACKPDPYGLYSAVCTITPGETLQAHFWYPTCDATCGTETWAGLRDFPNSSETFNPPVTTGSNPTTWTLQTTKDTPNVSYGGSLVGASSSNDQIDLRPYEFDVDVVKPFLQIVDKTTGKLVSGTTQTKIVGQKIHLEVSSTSGRQLSDIHWNITGKAIKDYIHGAPKEIEAAMPIDLSPADLQKKTDISFYWIPPGGDYSVTVSATDGDQQLEATATYNVLAPTGVDMKSTTGQVVAGPTGFQKRVGPYLGFGIAGKPGIEWTFRATAPAGGNGEIAGVQLVNTLRTYTCSNNGKTPTLSSLGAFILDAPPVDASPPKTPIYDKPAQITGGKEGEWVSRDSPGSALNLKEDGTVTYPWNHAFVRDNFETYFMYKPVGQDSIWVTIGLLYWGWTGEATRTGDPNANMWNLTADGHSIDPRGILYEVLPSWSGTTFYNLPYTPDPSCN